MAEPSIFSSIDSAPIGYPIDSSSRLVNSVRKNRSSRFGPISAITSLAKAKFLIMACSDLPLPTSGNLPVVRKPSYWLEAKVRLASTFIVWEVMATAIKKALRASGSVFSSGYLTDMMLSILSMVSSYHSTELPALRIAPTASAAISLAKVARSSALLMSRTGMPESWYL